MDFVLEDLIKIVIALLAGGLVGMEREFRDKSAGFRTLIFICVGSAAITILSARMAPESDPNRIAANIVTGIGFLGAGAILRDGGRVTGLTTAATIWLVAAVGMAIGGGQYMLAGVLVGCSIIVLWLFPFIEVGIGRTRDYHTYEVVCPVNLEKIDALEAMVREIGLKLRTGQHVKEGEYMRCSWEISGSPKKHARLTKFLFSDPDIREFKY
jgi:putative Mg2+ transporter-C (MgtC) family protein